MKKILFAMSLICCSVLASGAEILMEMNRQGTISLPQGQILGFNGIGLDRFVGYSFNGRDSLFWFETLEGDQAQKNYTLAMTFAVHKKPEGRDFMPLFFRTGRHNYLAVQPNGALVFAVWYLKMDGKNGQIKITTPKTIRIGKGRLERAAVTCETLPENRLRVKFWYNGGLVGEQTVEGKGFVEYKKNIYLGCSPENVKGFVPLDGVLQTVQLFNEVLPDEEIIALR